MLNMRKWIATVLTAGCIAIGSTAFAYPDVIFHVDVKGGPMSISQTQIQLHVGESVRIIKDSTSADPGLLRLMGHGPNAFDTVNTQNIGTSPVRGTALNGFVITGKQPGSTHLKLVPDYGDWNHAVDLDITVIN